MRRSGLAIPVVLLGLVNPALADSPDGEAPEQEVEAAEGEMEVDEGPQPDAKNGVVSGKLFDADTKEEIIDGQCTIVGTKHRGVSDADGAFAMKVPPGTYQVRCFFEGYKTARVDDVVVMAGQRVTLKVGLRVDEAKVEDEVVVEVDPDRATAATQIYLRKNAASVSDAVSAQDIAKTPDRSAADATKRVVGATVVDGRFIYVRGLGDRYTNSLLNGTPLPSPEPDLSAIPLDILPVNALSDITIFKTFTPDMPADFTGGSVRIATRTFPTKFFFQSSFTGGWNTQTTFRRGSTYAGSRTDFLGLDGGARQLPSNIAGSNGKITGLPPEMMEWYGESLSQRPRRLYDTTHGPSFSFSAAAGDTKQVLGNPLGWIVAVGYGRKFAERHETQRTFELEVDPAGNKRLIPKIDFAGTRSNAYASWSGLASVGYQLGEHHRFTATGLYSVSSEDDVLRFRGFSKNDDGHLTIDRARWVERKLGFAQVLGEHRLPGLDRALLKWNLFYGEARRDEPNNVQSVYQVNQAAEPGTLPEAKSGDGLTHFFSGQTETMRGAGIDWIQPLSRDDNGPKLKVGGLVNRKDRDFGARRFRYTYLRRRGQLDWLRSSPGSILDEDTIGTFAQVEENTRTTDVYTARQNVYAGYLMADMAVGPIRLIGGTRVEYTGLTVLSRDDLQAGAPETRDGFRKTDLLPSAAAVLKLGDDMNLRASVTQTIARPQFREIARFDYADFFNAQQVTGNPALRRAKVTNFDLRWELFPGADEVVAVSVFYKRFQDPIESSFVLATSQVFRKPINTQSARNLGVELEGRKSLKFLAPWLAPFSVLGNVTFVDSSVTIGKDQQGAATSLERPLQGQSPWVVNGALDWVGNGERTRARLSYNVFGRRIDAVGTNQVPDTYEMPRHQLDLAVSHRFGDHVDGKLSVENLLNAPYRFETGPEEASTYRLGQTFWLTLTHSL